MSRDPNERWLMLDDPPEPQPREQRGVRVLDAVTEETPWRPPPNLSLNEAAVAIHEMYRSLVLAGFSEGQALELCKAVLAGQHKST